MSRRSSWALAIAGLSIVLHICLSIYVAYSMVVLDRKVLDNKYDLVHTFLIIYSILEIAMIIASILLVIGVKNGRILYVPIWIFLSLTCTVMLCILLIWNGKKLDLSFAFKIVMIVVQVAMLYPVFALWYNMRYKRQLQQQQSIQSTQSQDNDSGFRNEVYPYGMQPQYPSTPQSQQPQQQQQQDGDTPVSATNAKQQFV